MMERKIMERILVIVQARSWIMETRIYLYFVKKEVDSMCANRRDDLCCERIVEYSNSKEGGMNDVQVVEVKRPRTHGLTGQSFRKDPK